MDVGTIYALSSAPGKAGVSVVRVSGPEALSSLKRIGNFSTPPRPREAVTKILRHPVTGEQIDHALILYFKGPASFTGEDVVEYHVHGSLAVLDALFAALASCPKHRMAEPGEFTRRAFENGKLDLTEAEAVADLIAAQTAMQRQQALAQLGGALARLYEGWREKLVRSMAYVEAVIDFPDEDVPDSETAKVRPDIEALITEMDAHLADGHRGERLREGFSIVLLGAPNAGKSSLLNALARREVAIVSPMAGTTRDVLEVHLDLGGYPVSVADTAGLRSVALEDDGGHGGIEAEGIRRALARAEQADIRLLLFDGCDPVLNAQTLAQLSDTALCVFTKADDPDFCYHAFPSPLSQRSENHVVSLSAKTGKNMDVLLRILTKEIAGRFDSVRDTPTLTRARHRAALNDALAHLRSALQASLPELMAEDLRMAARAIGCITGRVDVEDLLDVVFRDFCIGK